VSERRQQTGFGELRQVGARGLWGHAGRVGKLGRGQRSPIQESRQHRCSCRIADQPTDLGDERACIHEPNIPCGWTGLRVEHFDGDRSKSIRLPYPS
jgi:hypothetical protein